MVLKQSLASDPEVAQRVSRSGWGSAAVRLPVVESEFEVGTQFQVWQDGTGTE